MIIGLCGLAGSGKSTAADYLVKDLGFVRRRFAGPLKNMIKVLGLTDEHTDGALKEVPCDLLGGRTPRYAMQTLGTEWGRDLIVKDLWIRAWEASLPTVDDVVVDDCRFENEAAAIEQRGGVLVYLAGRGGIAGGHSSEGFIPPKAIRVDNSGSIAQLYDALDSIVVEHRPVQAANDNVRPADVAA